MRLSRSLLLRSAFHICAWRASTHELRLHAPDDDQAAPQRPADHRILRIHILLLRS